MSEQIKFHSNHNNPNIVNVEPALSAGSLFERGWSMVMYEKGCIEGHTQSYVKLINAYCKKTGQEICSDTVNKYLAKFTKEEFEENLRKFYDLPKTITPASILKAKDKVHELSEHEIQQKVCKYLDEKGYRYWAVPNGMITKLDYTYIAYMKSEGALRKGIFDMTILPKQGRVIFLELKTKKGKPSEEQKEWKKFFDENGYISSICYGYDECISFIEGVVNNENSKV